MRLPLVQSRPCQYHLKGAGLRPWLPADLLDLPADGGPVTVRPWYGDRTPIKLPRSRVRGLPPLKAARLRWGVAGIAIATAAMQQRGGPAPESDLAYAGRASPPRVIVARLNAPGKPIGPRPRGRITDPRYLRWLRTQPCICSEGCQRKAQGHHAGPRPVGRKSDDWRAVPLCPPSHLQYVHGQGHLPFLTAEETSQILLAQQVRHLLRYYGEVLRPNEAHWYKLGALADRLPTEERAGHLLVVLDLLIEHLLQLRREGRLTHVTV